jgi:hypothetical protein
MVSVIGIGGSGRSAVAEHITGTRWNGYRFWGLEGRRVERRA